MPYSLLLFDYDGTLCDTRNAIGHSLRRTFLELGRPELVEPILQAVVQQGLPLVDTVVRLHPAGTEPLPKDWVETYRTLYRTGAEELVTPFPGAQKVLATAAEQGHHIAIISNKGLPILENSLQRLGLREYASLVLGDAPTAVPALPLKPNAALFTQCIQPKFPGITSAQTLMIGDTATDLQFAQNCGIAACWASYGFGSEADCAVFQPTHRLGCLSDLLLIIS